MTDVHDNPPLDDPGPASGAGDIDNPPLDGFDVAPFSDVASIENPPLEAATGKPTGPSGVTNPPT